MSLSRCPEEKKTFFWVGKVLLYSPPFGRERLLCALKRLEGPRNMRPRVALLFVVARIAARLAFGHSSVMGNQRVHF